MQKTMESIEKHAESILVELNRIAWDVHYAAEARERRINHASR